MRSVTRLYVTYVSYSKKKLCAIYGKWTECLYTVDASTFDAHKKSDKKNSDEKKSNKQVFLEPCYQMSRMICLQLFQAELLWRSVAPEQCWWGARGDASTWCWDGPGHPRQRAHLEDNASAGQLV